VTPILDGNPPSKPVPATRWTGLARLALVAGCTLALAFLARAAPAQDEAANRRSPAQRLAAVEGAWADLRAAADRIEVASEAPANAQLPSPADLVRLREVGGAVRAELAALAGEPLADDDRQALERMTTALPGVLATLGETPGGAAAQSAADSPQGSSVDPTEALREATYEAYAGAAAAVAFEGETIDRLTVFAHLATTPDATARRRLFLSLAPVWAAVDGDQTATGSPYRRLVRASAPDFFAAQAPLARNLAALGLDVATVERWLERALGAWREATRPAPGSPALEPWDWHWSAGALSRQFANRLPLDALRPLHDAYYQALGAEEALARTVYDLAPRPGKTPVAYTTFHTRPRLAAGAGPEAALDAPPSGPGLAQVVASYREGGFDNLVELLHETGHAVHILAIRTRPAFADWPDSDPFTEALADVPALDAYEPWFQDRFLGTAAPLATSLRAKYAGIVLDMAWALFELRLYRDPQQDPNAVWTAITSHYLHIAPHPELSWWALRGQLIEAPGYMVNYGLGAFLAADLRARWQAVGPTLQPQPVPGERRVSSYQWLSENLYRFGLSEPSRQTVERFLGRPAGPEALLADLLRLAPASSEEVARPQAREPQRPSGHDQANARVRLLEQANRPTASRLPGGCSLLGEAHPASSRLPAVDGAPRG
jgi:hypothetical protein